MPRFDPLHWRIAIIVLAPALLVAWHLAVHDVIADTAGGLHYLVDINRMTGEACLRFPYDPTPEGLIDLAC